MAHKIYPSVDFDMERIQLFCNYVQSEIALALWVDAAVLIQDHVQLFLLLGTLSLVILWKNLFTFCRQRTELFDDAFPPLINHSHAHTFASNNTRRPLVNENREQQYPIIFELHECY